MVNYTNINPVVPHERTWIEITTIVRSVPPRTVVPHEGTWIEIIGRIG